MHLLVIENLSRRHFAFDDSALKWLPWQDVKRLGYGIHTNFDGSLLCTHGLLSTPRQAVKLFMSADWVNTVSYDTFRSVSLSRSYQQNYVLYNSRRWFDTSQRNCVALADGGTVALFFAIRRPVTIFRLSILSLCHSRVTLIEDYIWRNSDQTINCICIFQEVRTTF